MGNEEIAKVITERRFSDDELNRFRVILKTFNKLYYDYPQQTWHNTKWCGVHVYKAPTDLWVYQELIYEIRPDLIIETGTCEGGSALYLRDMMGCVGDKNGCVISIDISHKNVHEKVKDLKDDGIHLIEGDSINEETLAVVKANIEIHGPKKIMVILDSDHSKEHVLKELEIYSQLVSPGSILIVEDTNVDGPREAIEEWLPYHLEFEMNVMCEKFMLTFNRGGYLERKVEG